MIETRPRSVFVKLGVSSHLTRRRLMPIVTVQQSPRDLDARRRLVEGITQAFVEAYGVKPEAVQVFIHEVDHEHWAKGGRLAIDA